MSLGRVQRHAAVVSKVQALRGKLLKPVDYAKALQTDDLIGLLRQWYPDLPASGGIYELEMAFMRKFQEEIEPIYLYYTFAYREVLKRIFMRFEIERVKRALRYLTTHDESPHPPILLSHILEHVDEELFQKAETYQQLADAMKYPPYRKIVLSMKAMDEDRLFHAEMSLDKEYFRGLVDIRDKLDPIDREILLEAVGVHVDMLNLNWIRRAKATFAITPEEIFNYTLSRGKRIGIKQQRALSYLSLKELDDWIAHSAYHTVFDGNPLGQEARIEGYLYRTLRALEKAHPMSLAPLISYLHEVEYQMRDLDMIVEARDYQVDIYHELLGKQVGAWR